MRAPADAHHFLEQEAGALLTRLRRVESFAMRETSVPAAAITFEAQAAIERFMATTKMKLERQLVAYQRWLRSAPGRRAPAAEKQRRFTLLRLRFVTILSQFDMFSDVMTQRSEHDTGVWLSGLDAAAADALAVPGGYFKAPPITCYLAPGHGAAIRRAKTPLPGGGTNPIAIIRIPRERMIGSGVASSLVHEVGHQAAGQLDLVRSMQPLLDGLARGNTPEGLAWRFWGLWISEILADFWSAARLGIGATVGLMGVVSLPKFFVFRLSADDPHPPPVIRVKVSCALGKALYPDPQWDALARVWESLYPSADQHPNVRALYRLIEQTLPAFVALLINHRPPSLRGRSLREVVRLPDRNPALLRREFRQWSRDPSRLQRNPPTRVFAVIGQAKADGVLTPEGESRLLDRMLKSWALRTTFAQPAYAGSAGRPVPFEVVSSNGNRPMSHQRPGMLLARN